MKKSKLIGVLAGITALAVGAGATYAWFTDTAGPVDLTVNTATIAIDSIDAVEPLALYLPGEQVGFMDCTFTNESTRESVVEFTLEATELTFTDDAGGDYDPVERAERKRELLAAFNANLAHSGLFEKADGTERKHTIVDNRIYIWLDAEEPLNEDGKFSITLAIPDELGGNVSIPSATTGPDGRTKDRPEEHEATLKVTCQAYAVQGTYAALADVFDTTIADHFFQ